MRATSPHPAPCTGIAWLLALAAAVGLLGLGLYASAADRTSAGQELQVIDGDTLQNGAEVFRLYGTGAPQLGQSAGGAASPGPAASMPRSRFRSS